MKIIMYKKMITFFAKQVGAIHLQVFKNKNIFLLFGGDGAPS